ncbi:MAG TPA: minichromosome maintenance protein MCM [Candidatus Saccharimonadales bacterium]|nr:minichromosome maintenance protein MCM [Candidatus Saccharimonadales bacterium]
MESEVAWGDIENLTSMQTSQQNPEERFQEFLRSYIAEDEYKYRKRLGHAALAGARSITVDFEDLITFDPELARLILEKPDEYLEYLDRSTWAQLKIEDPEYAELVKRLRVRFRKLPEKNLLRKIGSESIGRLLSIDGIIVRSTSVKPLLIKAAFQCKKCNAMSYVEQAGTLMRGPGVCAHCRSKIFEFLEKQSTFMNSQEIRIQERPEDLPPGQLPRAMDVKLLEDLVDAARPGDRVAISGIARAQQEFVGRKARLRTFDLLLDANFVEAMGKEVEIVEITPDDERQIRELAKDPFIHRKLIASLAPSIYGYGDMKEAVLYLLFSGVQKRLPDGVTIRSEINVLLVGDPGTAKSQLLQYVSRIAPRGLYTSGRGTTAAGLTAAVVREKSGGMVLEAGALVLADKGVACIDEIDKMRPEDRVAIHEALEQHTVSVAKGGIVATLNARAAVLAAANPSLGRYDPYRNITDNINLPVTLLSRFDLLFIMKDVPEPDSDSKMSEHILTLHRMKTTPEEPPMSPEMLRKYIAYAKRIDPELTEDVVAELRQYYLKMRSMSGSTESPVAITPRQLEALVRLSEARAKSFLRNKVQVEDARAIIRLMTLSLQDVGIDMATGKMDIDVIMTGKPKSLRDKMQVVLSTFADLEKQLGIVEDSTLYQALSRKVDITDDEARRLVDQLIREGIIYSPKPGHLKRTAA